MPAERREGGAVMTGSQLIELIVGGVAIAPFTPSSALAFP
jgi:hypothetical protein